MEKPPTTPLISVLITYYNQINTIERALESVLVQDYENLEIIIGDDCSSEGDLPALLEKYTDSRLKLVRNDQNLGRRANYKKLLFEESTGDLATILNADDFLSNEFYFSQVVDKFQSEEDVALVFGHTNIFLEYTNEKVGDAIMEDLQPMMDGNWLFINLPRGIVIPHVTSVYRKDLATELNFYRSDSISEDWESLYRIILGNKVGFIKEISGYYGRHLQNVSKDIQIETLLHNVDYIKAPFDLAVEKGEIEIRQLEKWKEKMLFRYFVKCYIKISLWEKSNIGIFMQELKKQHPRLARKISLDYRIAIFNIIKSSPRLLRYCFSKYSKQESVIADFLQYAAKR